MSRRGYVSKLYQMEQEINNHFSVPFRGRRIHLRTFSKYYSIFQSASPPRESVEIEKQVLSREAKALGCDNETASYISSFLLNKYVREVYQVSGHPQHFRRLIGAGKFKFCVFT